MSTDMPWIVTTSASAAQASAVTGVIEWAPADDGVTWTVPVRGIAMSTVAALREAGYTAGARQQVPEAGQRALAFLAEIGELRAAKRAASDALREALTNTDEGYWVRAARADGVHDAEIARVLCCDRQHIYQTVGKRRLPPDMTG